MKKTLGYISGFGGRFGRKPFFRICLSLESCKNLNELMAKADAENRHTVNLAASYQQPDRLRLYETIPPDYEFRASTHYIRGDAIRIQGKEGVSCSLAISAKFGVPSFQEQLRIAMDAAEKYVELRIPSRELSFVEFVPDVAVRSEADVLTEASVASILDVLPSEDFSDWETDAGGSGQ
ncbi:MAG: hypothetical protein ABSH08_14030 [Tepidisphaeraceae bacterium]|jgi:hypothetical protein